MFRSVYVSPVATTPDPRATTEPAPRDALTILAAGAATFRRMPVSGSLFAVIVFGLFWVGRASAAERVAEGSLAIALLIDFVGLVVATVASLPWFRTTLRAHRDGAELGPAGRQIKPMLVATLFFWGGVLLGIRYLYGIPSVFVLIWYGVFGYAVADGESSGLKALGISVDLGQGRRTAVAAVGLVLALLNLLALLPVGYNLGTAGLAISGVLLVVTTNVSMGAGAELYDRLRRSRA